MGMSDRPQAAVLKVGRVIRSLNRPAIAVGWTFDCKGVVPAVSITSDGVRLVAGYTHEELDEIIVQCN